ncbi:HepA Superfamily II DNA RNA helicase SNF2 family [Pyrenophora tritici-repentis]|nr:HepA Superfamily II DNA RNA helicase SNF2 family [Pyrenophora tritici-repentis]KAI1522412.1 HepA Superfamily II DNA RNA helicase SNF2 family [Pyrenophora tritici-repentis]KAI1559193.1 HepA Superfamily II DNA RNA helicase SNF2 family [Pyrenophora tritici-repentis]KAI1559473.1 HepA Superfamily II DNA RNA helicase SNF2 family [Pyrenophora tritici-repentis]KAI1591368.1 HepA Superfamily II DNA RNA helicase SNF2 family [Pyrenophora tritici-repentis]
MTISCSAVGLDITAASRAYILEPQWNPTVEEQALARVHRMGQTKPVTTIRFVMENTFEERVVETQERKRRLAELLLSSEEQVAEHGVEKLKYFRSLLR